MRSPLLWHWKMQKAAAAAMCPAMRAMVNRTSVVPPKASTKPRHSRHFCQPARSARIWISSTMSTAIKKPLVGELSIYWIIWRLRINEFENQVQMFTAPSGNGFDYDSNNANFLETRINITFSRKYFRSKGVFEESLDSCRLCLWDFANQKLLAEHLESFDHKFNVNNISEYVPLE